MAGKKTKNGMSDDSINRLLDSMGNNPVRHTNHYINRPLDFHVIHFCRGPGPWVMYRPSRIYIKAFSFPFLFTVHIILLTDVYNTT